VSLPGYLADAVVVLLKRGVPQEDIPRRVGGGVTLQDVYDIVPSVLPTIRTSSVDQAEINRLVKLVAQRKHRAELRRAREEMVRHDSASLQAKAPASNNRA